MDTDRPRDTLPAGERLPFLTECAGYAREQVLFHMRHRDQWLKLQLFTQGGLLALAAGIEVGGLRSDAAVPGLLSLAVPLAFVFALLYVVEDRMVALFCGYIHSLSREEMRLSGARAPIPNAEMVLSDSPWGREFLTFRLWAQFAGFLLIPGALAGARFLEFTAWGPVQAAEALVAGLLWTVMLAVLVRAHGRHRDFHRLVDSFEG